MAIQPVDLQLAYMASPLTAATASVAQAAPQVAQEAAQASFVSKLQERQESIEETKEAHGNRVNERTEGDGGPDWSQHRGHHPGQRDAEQDDGAQPAAGEEHHFIDVTA
ncbi:MAG: hypothetical protein ACYDHD_01940 [Vulcanimicrobiaceae bacterium]